MEAFRAVTHNVQTMQADSRLCNGGTHSCVSTAKWTPTTPQAKKLLSMTHLLVLKSGALHPEQMLLQLAQLQKLLLLPQELLLLELPLLSLEVLRCSGRSDSLDRIDAKTHDWLFLHSWHVCVRGDLKRIRYFFPP